VANEIAGERLTVTPLSCGSRKALIERLYAGFAQAGFDYREAERTRTHSCMWTRPPLFTTLELNGEPMQMYLNIPVIFRADEMTDIYDRFIAGFLFSNKFRRAHSDQWLRRKLKIQHYTGRSLFVRPKPHRVRFGLHMNLVQFAALVAYNHRAEIEEGPDTFVVTTPKTGYSFGVRGGRLVTNLRRHREVICKGLSYPSGLQHMRRGDLERDAEPTLFDTLKTWSAQNVQRLGQQALALHLGVEILRWRSTPGGVPGQLRLLTSYQHSTDALAKACADARQYESFASPLKALWDLFSPFIGRRDFENQFGSHAQLPLPDGLKSRWDLAINTLDPRYEV
jgi:hypothetical protein